MVWTASARDAALGATRSKQIFGTDEQRFWAKVDKTETCWNWTAGAHPKGYGLFYLHDNGKTIARQAHRFSYELAHGPIPDGLTVDHKCHNPACVNPAHLRLATMKEQNENRHVLQATNKSGVRGVYWREGKHRRAGWIAQVKHNRKVHHVGRFDRLADAEAAVIAKRLELFTHSDGR